jgi:nucleoside-diphosphate-sugar epimerase
MGELMTDVKINTTEELEEIMTRPYKELIELMGRLNGDIIILGANGKMGPTITRMAKRAIDQAERQNRVITVARIPMTGIVESGIESITCDLLNLEAVHNLPRVENVIFMAGRKFGSTGNEHLTWATNILVPYHVASTFVDSRIVMFSTGAVYPIMHLKTGGATEETETNPIGEYAQSCLGRERIFEFHSRIYGQKVVHIRLNYSVELRYGVLFDVAWNVWNDKPVDVTTGYTNVIWQGDACNQILLSLEKASSPPDIINIAGTGIISIRETALKFGNLFKKNVKITGKENDKAYLSNASRAESLYGIPKITVEQVIEWIAHWIKSGNVGLGKPTHFETQDGRY